MKRTGKIGAIEPKYGFMPPAGRRVKITAVSADKAEPARIRLRRMRLLRSFAETAVIRASIPKFTAQRISM